MPKIVTEPKIISHLDDLFVEFNESGGLEERTSLRECGPMWSIVATFHLIEETLKIQMQSRPKIPDQDQAKPMERQLAFTSERGFRRAMAGNEIGGMKRTIESVCYCLANIR
jgi:hypothetical protein